MPATQDQLLLKLRELDIEYQRHSHPAVFTVEQAQAHCADIPGKHCKNLFLRTRKKSNWLVVLGDDTQVDLKQMAVAAGAGAWSFAQPKRLMEFLGVEPGSVTPFALINDHEHHVSLVIERNLLNHSLLNFHPLVNTSTIGISASDLLKFTEYTNHQPVLADF